MVGMYEAGLGLREIAAAVNCSQRTVKRWLNRFDKEGTVETRERCGRKRATTAEQDEAIVRLATQTPITAAKSVLPALGLTCSVDTIRERLHKAGIHNWSPSRKYIQKIPLGDANGTEIQQPVWRPTGTQLGKKKSSKDINKEEKIVGIKKKKSAPKKVKAKDVYIGDGAPAENIKAPNDRQQFAYPQQSVPQPNEIQTSSQAIHSQIEFGNALNLTLQTQPPHNHYQHPGISMAQNWPLDLVHGSDHYSQTQPNSIPPQGQLQSEIQQQHLTPDNPNIRDSQDNEQSSGVECDQNKESSDDSATQSETRKRTKKGGKAKGTLETSVEIRNRMIGMAEAGLSTLSIALAIDRSERTVKRWLERWHKEGNVQTKERKGRRRITTKEEDEAIIAMATQQPLTAAKHVAPALGLKCSVDTIRERLHKAGIHSWKLGKKQGEGNAVHTVHLWKPSGNRPNKLKLPGEKRRRMRSNKKRDDDDNVQKRPKKRKSEPVLVKMDPPPTSMIPEQPVTLTFHNPGTVTSYPTPVIQQPVHAIPPTTIVPPQTHPSADPTTASQPVQPMDAMMQQRPDCRLAPTIGVPVSTQGNTGVVYSSCMVVSNNNHAGHMEQSDPLNYEQYMWSF